MSKKNIIYLVAAIVIVLIIIVAFSSCGKNAETIQDIPNEQTLPETTATAVPPEAAPKLTEQEVQVIKEEQKKVVAQAKQDEAKAEKAVASKVVTSSVAKSAPIPDGFPVQNVPIIQGAQILSASKSGNTYNMVIKVNVPAEDSYKYYFDLYDSIGSAKINAKVENKSLSVERTKSGLKADFEFSNDGENSSTVTMKVSEQ